MRCVAHRYAVAADRRIVGASRVENVRRKDVFGLTERVLQAHLRGAELVFVQIVFHHFERDGKTKRQNLMLLDEGEARTAVVVKRGRSAFILDLSQRHEANFIRELDGHFRIAFFEDFRVFDGDHVVLAGDSTKTRTKKGDC